MSMVNPELPSDISNTDRLLKFVNQFENPYIVFFCIPNFSYDNGPFHSTANFSHESPVLVPRALSTILA